MNTAPSGFETCDDVLAAAYAARAAELAEHAGPVEATDPAGADRPDVPLTRAEQDMFWIYAEAPDLGGDRGFGVSLAAIEHFSVARRISDAAPDCYESPR